MKSGKHIGHCQACGARQVVIPGQVMAKHGYKVKGFGFFMGVCRGSGQAPLEVSRDFLDVTIVALTDYAARADQAGADLASGKRFPSDVQKMDERQNGVWTEGYYQKRPYNPKGDKWIDKQPVMVEWADASAIERSKGIEEAAYDAAREARNARDHIKGLHDLAARVHGQPLTDRWAAKPAKVEPVKVDVAAVIETGACQATFKTKAARKEALEQVSRQFEKLAQAIRNLHLAIPHAERTKAGDEVYFGIPHQPNHWRAKHAAATLAVFPEAAPIIAEIEKVVAARDAIKAAV